MSQNGTFLALQIKAFGPNNFHAGIKKCHFGKFSKWAGMAVPCQSGPQQSLTGIKKIFWFWVPINPQKDWKAKLDRAHFFKVQCGKIPMCCASQIFSNLRFITDLIYRISRYLSFFCLVFFPYLFFLVFSLIISVFRQLT